MKIYIMRHGPAEDQAPTGRDFDRKLTSSGRARTELAAHELGRWERPKRVISSPLVRTIETAEIVVSVLSLAFERIGQRRDRRLHPQPRLRPRNA